MIDVSWSRSFLPFPMAAQTPSRGKHRQGEGEVRPWLTYVNHAYDVELSISHYWPGSMYDTHRHSDSDMHGYRNTATHADLVTSDGDVPDTMLMMCIVVWPVWRRKCSGIFTEIRSTLLCTDIHTCTPVSSNSTIDNTHKIELTQKYTFLNLLWAGLLHSHVEQLSPF